MGYHSADYNKDWKIELAELTRVISLYNTTNVITGDRTGCYKVDNGSIDGFASDPTRTIDEPVVLERYHSADYNRDGRIDDAELARVQELYNYGYNLNPGPGFVRTGQYHDYCPSSIDGFGLGPVQLNLYQFDDKHLPIISTKIVPAVSSTQAYKLRLKFIDLPDAPDLQATDQVNNNNTIIDTIPDPGVYRASIYWNTYSVNPSTGALTLITVSQEQIVDITIGEERPSCNNDVNNRECVCGPKDEPPPDPDKGNCFPYRTKRTCEAPVLPEPPCNDDSYYTIYDPSSPTKFKVIAKLLDSSCEPITDSNDNPILTTLS